MKNGNTKLVCNLIFVVFLAGTIGCGGKGLLGNISERISGPDFELTVWDETFAHGGLANKVVMVREDLPTTTIVRIEVDGASDLKAIYCTLNYNAGRYTPKSVTIEPLLADGSGLLELANYSLDGKVDIGQAIAGLPGFPGFEGSGLFAEIEFSNGSRPRVRRTSSAPTDDYSRTTLYKNGNQLSWRNYCTGDYDQNGEVNVADITPLAINYGATGPFDVGQAVSCVDGDWNGEINLADITPIATAYGNTVEGYNIYASPGGAGFPIGSTDANGPGVTFLDSVAFDQAAALDGERKLFSYPLASEVPGDDYWVRPFVGKADGIASTLAQTGGSGSGLELVLSNTPAEGDGATPGTAYIVDDQTNYSFEVVRSLGGTNTTVTLDAETRFIVSNASAGTVDPATAILNITVGHEGLVAVQAAYEASGTLYSNYVWLQIGTAGTYLALTIGNPPTDGSGLSTNDPFMGNDTTDYQFTASLINGGSSTDVTTDALTTFTVSNSGAGEVNPATGVLNVTDGFEGIFNVQAVYEFEGFLFSNLMWVQVGGGGPTTEAQRYFPLTLGMAYKYSVARIENPPYWGTQSLEGTDMICRTRFNPIGDGIWFRTIGYPYDSTGDLVEGLVIKDLSITGIVRNENRDEYGPFYYGETSSTINYVLPDPIPSIGESWPILLSMDGYASSSDVGGEINDNLHRVEGDCTIGAIEDVLTEVGWYTDCIRIDFDLSYQSPWTIINWTNPLHASDWTGSYWLSKDIGLVKIAAEASVSGWGIASIEVELEQYDQETELYLVSQVSGGVGTNDDPFVLLPGQVYDFSVLHPQRGNIASDTDVAFVASEVGNDNAIPNSDVSFVNGRMSVSSDFRGPFKVNSKVGKIDSNPRLVFFKCYDSSPFYETENNDSFAEANALPSLPFSSSQVLFSLGTHGGYYDGDNSDYFSFVLDQTSNIAITMVGQGSHFNLFDSSESIVNSSGSGTTPEYWKNYSLLAPGLYYVHCQGDYNFGEDYTLAIETELPEPELSVTNPPVFGSGTFDDPYLTYAAGDFVFALDYPGQGDVATDPDTEYTIHGDDVGTLDNSDATLYMNDGFVGEFYITATYLGIGNTVETNQYFSAAPDFDPPADALIALPNRVSIPVGGKVQFTIRTGTILSSKPFQYMNGIGFTIDNGIGFVDNSDPAYVPTTFNAGSPGGSAGYIDGFWSNMNPEKFLLPPDNFIVPTIMGDGRMRIDFNLTPVGGSDIHSVAGDLINFEISFNTQGSYEIGFTEFIGVERTYYTNSATTIFLWSDISNNHAGLPNVITVFEP